MIRVYRYAYSISLGVAIAVGVAISLASVGVGVLGSMLFGMLTGIFLGTVCYVYLTESEGACEFN